MKIKSFLILALLCTAMFSRAAHEVLTVAVFDFESKDESIRDFGAKISSLLNANLSSDAAIILVERAELEKVIGEQELGLSGAVSTETAAKVGHLTGAKVLITGRVMKVDKELVVVAKIIGTETSRVYGEMATGTTSSPVTDLAMDLAKKISGIVAAKGDTLAAKAPTREDRVEAIKKALPEGKRPTVLVKIPEQHFGAPVVDPAAETELGLILLQCGFTMVDNTSAIKPDLTISGEAFSAFGLRKGNLISCKARVELKVTDPSGRVVASDRQTTVAVDIAEQTAAKTALQNAAAELAVRVLPKLKS